MEAVSGGERSINERDLDLQSKSTHLALDFYLKNLLNLISSFPPLPP